MASSFIAAGEECNEQNKKAAFGSLRRQCSSNEASFGSHATKSCVCAPTTHVGSFKCRLHRVNSPGYSSQPAPQPSHSSSSIEAQKKKKKVL